MLDLACDRIVELILCRPSLRRGYLPSKDGVAVKMGCRVLVWPSTTPWQDCQICLCLVRFIRQIICFSTPDYRLSLC